MEINLLVTSDLKLNVPFLLYGPFPIPVMLLNFGLGKFENLVGHLGTVAVPGKHQTDQEKDTASIRSLG
jgi:hypothetical protein